MENKFLLDLPTRPIQLLLPLPFPVSPCIWTEGNVCCSTRKSTQCFPHRWCVHKPWPPADKTNAASALALPSFHVELPIFFFFPWSDAAVPRPSQSCVVQPAAWLLLSSIHAVWVGAWRSCIHCQEQLGPPSRRWELVKLKSPGLWRGLPAA